MVHHILMSSMCHMCESYACASHGSSQNAALLLTHDQNFGARCFLSTVVSYLLVLTIVHLQVKTTKRKFGERR